MNFACYYYYCEVYLIAYNFYTLNLLYDEELNIIIF